jgi:hypothetical protein
VSWRVGKRVPINVYDGDRPVCQCQTAVDAARIVRAVNRMIDPPGEDELPERLPPQEPDLIRDGIL